MQLYNVAKLVVAAGPSHALIDATRKDSDSFVLQECGQGRKDIIPQNVLEDLITSNKFEVVRVTELLPQFVSVNKPLVIIIGISSPGIAKLLSELDKDLPRELSISELIDNGYLQPINVAQDTFDIGAVAGEVDKTLAEQCKPLCATHSLKLDANANICGTVALNVDGYARGGTVKTTAREFVITRLEAAWQDVKQFEANLHDLMVNVSDLQHQIAEAKREVVRWEVLVKEV